MKKNLLNKMAKAASVALVAGAMVCGASLTANTNASAQGDPYLSLKQNESLEKVSNKKAEHVISQKGAKATRKAYAELFSHKATKKHARKGNKAAKHEEKGIRAGKYNSHKLGAVKKSNKKVRNAKKINKRARKAIRRNRRARRANRRVIRRAIKPMNRRAYRHEQVRRGAKSFRKTAYYHKVWTHAEKVNKKGMNFDLRAAKFDQKKGYKRAAKNARHMAKYLQGYVNHDVHMLNLAK